MKNILQCYLERVAFGREFMVGDKKWSKVYKEITKFGNHFDSSFETNPYSVGQSVKISYEVYGWLE
jgi:hypothetical protein